MLVLGLILILLSAGALVAVLSSGTDDKSLLFGGNLEVPSLVMFLAGAATLLLFIMGLELVRSGTRRANENRKTKKKLKQLERQQQEQRDHQPVGTATSGPAATGSSSHPGTTDGTTGTPGSPTDPGTSSGPPPAR
jgi:uncharacterized integral membrane protein